MESCSQASAAEEPGVASEMSAVEEPRSLDGKPGWPDLCFPGSITVSRRPGPDVVSRLFGHLQDAYGLVDALIVDAQDPLQRNRLAHLARSLYKAMDAARTLR